MFITLIDCIIVLLAEKSFCTNNPSGSFHVSIVKVTILDKTHADFTCCIAPPFTMCVGSAAV